MGSEIENKRVNITTTKKETQAHRVENRPVVTSGEREVGRGSAGEMLSCSVVSDPL